MMIRDNGSFKAYHAAVILDFQNKGKVYYFCALGCKAAFEMDPEKYLKAAPSGAGHHGGH